MKFRDLSFPDNRYKFRHMAKSKLYTATGDAGQTSLVGGERVSKTSARLEAYGTIDEFSSFLGVALTAAECPEELRGQMTEVQSRLFDMGSYLATASDPLSEAPAEIRGIREEDVNRLEGWIDALDEKTPKANAFVLPGGSHLAAHLHVARTVCRRAERQVYRLAQEAPVSKVVTTYLNRLSDYLFIAARYANFIHGAEELVWHAAK